VFSIAARIGLATLSACALVACGPSHEEELEKQLAEAKATAAADAAALKAERGTGQAGGDQQSLEQFYAGDGGADAPEDAAPEDGGPADDIVADDADDGPSAPQAAPAPAPPPAPEPMPVGPPNPEPQ
jgi:hypothetical protein